MSNSRQAQEVRLVAEVSLALKGSTKAEARARGRATHSVIFSKNSRNSSEGSKVKLVALKGPSSKQRGKTLS